MTSSVSQNVTRNEAASDDAWKWTAPKEDAAVLVAADRLSDEQIADRLKITRRTLARWKATPEFQDRVEEAVAAFRKSVISRGIADLYRRLDTYQRLADGLETVIEERAAASEMQEVPGGKTGLITGEIKEVKVTWDHAKGKVVRQNVCEYRVDTALTRELRETLKQAAIETGQWTEKKDLSGSLRLDRPDLTKLSAEELDALDAILEKTAAPG